MADEKIMSTIVLVQSCIRKYLARCKIYRAINDRYEKIYYPKKNRFYYYDTLTDTSSWSKPLLLFGNDIEKISPSYEEDEASIMIQCAWRSYYALKKVRKLYKIVVTVIHDDSSNADYYYNPITGFTSWNLPKFMNDKLDGHYDDNLKKILNKSKLLKKKKNAQKQREKRKNEKKIRDGDDNDDDSSKDSELSESDELMIEKRRQGRKYPR
jgi:hypothetical protein